MKTLKSVLLKIVEFVGYVLLIRYVFNLFSRKDSGVITDTYTDIKKIDVDTEAELSDSEQQHIEVVEILDVEKKRVDSMPAHELTSEFDREFGGVQIVKADGSD